MKNFMGEYGLIVVAAIVVLVFVVIATPMGNQFVNGILPIIEKLEAEMLSAINDFNADTSVSY